MKKNEERIIFNITVIIEYDNLMLDLSNDWTNNRSSKKVMLGSSGYEGKFYNEIAEREGFRYFYSPNYENYKNTYWNSFVREINLRFLDSCIADNCQFYFSHNPTTAPNYTSLYMEYSYLVNYFAKNYGGSTLIQQGVYWLLVPLN